MTWEKVPRFAVTRCSKAPPCRRSAVTSSPCAWGMKSRLEGEYSALAGRCLVVCCLVRVNSVEGMVTVRRARAAVVSSWELYRSESLLFRRAAEVGLVSILARSRECASSVEFDVPVAMTREDWKSGGGVETRVMVQSWKMTRDLMRCSAALG